MRLSSSAFWMSNTPLTRPSSAPARSISAGLRKPSRTSSAPMTRLLPAPVAPVKQLSPGDSSIRASAITARLEMWSSRSMGEDSGFGVQGSERSHAQPLFAEPRTLNPEPFSSTDLTSGRHRLSRRHHDYLVRGRVGGGQEHAIADFAAHLAGGQVSHHDDLF